MLVRGFLTLCCGVFTAVVGVCFLVGVGGCVDEVVPVGLKLGDPSVEACRPLRLVGDWENSGVVVLGCDELVEHHPRLFTDIAAAVGGEAVLVGLVRDDARRRVARELLTAAGLKGDAVRFVQVRANTMWVRDYGPMPVRGADGATLFIDWGYPSRQKLAGLRADDLAPLRLGKALGVPVISAGLRADGGNILTNGDGLIVASTALLTDNAAGGYGPDDVRRVLGECTGGRRVLFVEPLAGDRTRHADMFICFLATDLVVVGRCDPGRDPVNARRLDLAASKLGEIRTSRGPMRVRRAWMPPRLNGRWRTYTNVLFAGNKLLVPIYSGVDPQMQQGVLGLYRRLLPRRTVVPINADSLVAKEGALHCIALNLPAAAIEKLREPNSSPAGIAGHWRAPAAGVQTSSQ